MSKNYFKNDYYRKKSRPKTLKTKKKKPTFVCKCCKNKFITQERFSNSDKKYKDYCSSCRNICFLCRCRHGGRGNTCSKYCADRYKKIRWVWRNNTKRNVAILDKNLKKFNLEKIDIKFLKVLFGRETSYIISRSEKIKKSMLDLQDLYNLKDNNSKLIIDPYYWIDKKTFYVYENTKNINLKRLEDINILN